ncbi:CGNR zinc finger domain-containing protein [Frigoribacterium sp. ACAM 257]|uniref:CGNR zinc finger domain-containing protein n=1 Tax=Frigoribacterium sp. ACAM 257 TaxID=2508998 RepID=UPI0011B9FBBF|nr:CGNR zinc finger domain-containing protein [Frigoribacterium sp. ACAM 257]TWX35556.1 CGNR zinc finger domain-containing protein [Frigoribacterium sp. ACAM 257]
MLTDEELLLAVLNSAPVVDGHVTDALEGDSGRELALSWGGVGTVDEVGRLRRARAALQAVVRGTGSEALDELASVADGAVQTPRVTHDGVVWDLVTAGDARLATEVVLAWSSVSDRLPGRLRACANLECNLFLVDHSRPGTAKWCSMASCGNRMKARAHAGRGKI